MKIRVDKWDLETEGENGEKITVTPEEAGVTEGVIYELDVETIFEGMDEISDRTGWLIISCQEI